MNAQSPQGVTPSADSMQASTCNHNHGGINKMKNPREYIPKKYQSLVTEVYREWEDCDHRWKIIVTMEWDDGFCRSFVCDSIDEMQWAIRCTAEDRDFQF